MSDIFQQVQALIERCNAEQKQAIFDMLKHSCTVHQLERDWHASAEMILDAIAQSGDLTQRGVKGVIADRSFHRLIVPYLARTGWRNEPIYTDEMYDADLRNGNVRVTVQVKMQRRERGVPKVRMAEGAPHWVVEVQKTRSGQDAEGGSTRPYAYGSFDILAVNLYASSSDWSHYVYTVANWLLPRADNQHLIAVMQPVSQHPTAYWTSNFEECVHWLLSGEMRRLPNFDNSRGRSSPAINDLF